MDNRMPVIIPSAKCASYIFTSKTTIKKKHTHIHTYIQPLIIFKFAKHVKYNLRQRLDDTVVQSTSCNMCCLYRHFYEINIPRHCKVPSQIMDTGFIASALLTCSRHWFSLLDYLSHNLGLCHFFSLLNS